MDRLQDPDLALPSSKYTRQRLGQINTLIAADRLDEAQVAAEALLSDLDEKSTSLKSEVAILLAKISSRQFRFEQALRHVLLAVQAAEEGHEPLRQSRGHAEHARILNHLGLTAEAVSASYAAIRLASSDPGSLARALAPLGIAQQALASPEEGMQTFQAMLAHAQHAGDLELQAWANRGLCGASLIAHQLTNAAASVQVNSAGLMHLAQAERHADEAVRLAVAEGCARSLRISQYLQANVYILKRDPGKARQKINEMLAGPEAGGMLHRALALKSLAKLEMLEHDYEHSLVASQQSLALFERLGDLREVTDACAALSRVFEAKEDFREALSWHRRFHEGYLEFASQAARVHAAAMAVRVQAKEARALAEAAGARADLLERRNTALAAEAEELARTALEDGLTGIANRRRFDREVRSMMADRRRGKRSSIALLDVDHFKRVNDHFSHVIGDEVLRRLAGLLKQNLRAEDLACRYGGEEFAILLSGLDAEQAVPACERLRSAVQAADWSVLHPQLDVTVSIGIAQLDEVDGDELALLKLVDRRLYEAKGRGRNCVVGPRSTQVHTPSKSIDH